MRLLFLLVFSFLFASLVPGCVDPENLTLTQNVNVVVVDGTITNLTEPQVIWLNRSKSDPVTGRFGTVPLRDVTIEIQMDSSLVVRLTETTPGRYLAPDSFRGQVGHSYQLRFTLSEGTRYESSVEVMQAVPDIGRINEHFNSSSFPSGTQYHTQAANEFFVDWRDPADQHNYYRWDWKLWERQDWCRTCSQGFYYVYDRYDKTKLLEDCFPENNIRNYFVNDYPCRTECWEIIHNYDTNVYDDQFTNGHEVQRYQVAKIPYLQSRACLVEIRQTSLTQPAYRFYKSVQEQTQNTGGLADSPPMATIGNVHNLANDREKVVGYFTASAVTAIRYWLDRRANTSTPPGLFQGLTSLLPSPPGLARDPNTDDIKPAPAFGSAANAACIPSDSRTPFKPEGWRE